MAEIESELDGVVAEVYRGRLDDFVGRRDAAAKKLRSTGEREAAARVKTLRKPSRLAWALDQAALENREAVDALVGAVSQTVEAQARGGDVRAAIAGLRAAARVFASRAAEAAHQAGLGIDSGALVNAVFAVLGTADSFEQLRRGHLTDVPEAGGLDLLTALSPPTDPAPRPAGTAQPAPRQTPATDASAEGASLEAEARAAAERAMAALAAARARSVAVREALAKVEAELRAAEVRLRDTESEIRTLTSQRGLARQEAEASEAELVEAERATADAERRLGAAILGRRDASDRSLAANRGDL